MAETWGKLNQLEGFYDAKQMVEWLMVEFDGLTMFWLILARVFFFFISFDFPQCLDVWLIDFFSGVKTTNQAYHQCKTITERFLNP